MLLPSVLVRILYRAEKLCLQRDIGDCYVDSEQE